MRSHRTVVRDAATGGAGWTSVQYAAAALHLLNADNNAVPKYKMQELSSYSSSSGVAVLDALVAANALCVRTHSVFASDIPVQAFADDDVVTAALPADLHVMSLLRAEFQQTVDQHDAVQRNAAISKYISDMRQ
jgi:hypothetical protein